MKAERKYSGLEIAIIGMAGRFPGAGNVNEFWNNLKNGVESISFLSDEDIKKYEIEPSLLENPNFVPALGGVLQGKDIFDASFFNYSPREAETMDPQFRLLHECSWHALEDAGYEPESYNGEIGIYAGASSNLDWSILNLISGRTELLGSLTSLTLTDKDFLPHRISYCLNLKGPAVGVQTACSTSLTAVHMASRALLTSECDMALAGGVKITTFPAKGYVYQEGMLSPTDGHCRSFDAKAVGSIGGDGIGVVVLKRLKNAIADGDNIHAVIIGSAANNDGKRKVGFAAPSVEAQAYVIKKALHIARVEHESITYIETQGIGTPHGDSIELEALKQAFATDIKGFCGIGSVKTNIGHLDAAAGIAGLIKTVLALKHRLIPPSINFETPNPHLDFVNSPFYVNTKLSNWENGKYPLRAGVSCFGMGGTNVHVVLQETPALTGTASSRTDQLILLSAKTKPSLDKATKNLSAYLKENPGINLADAAYTLQVGRKAFSHRRVLVAHDVNGAVHELTSPDSTEFHTSFTQQENRPVVLMFPGEGSQYIGMGQGIYQTEPLFREEMDLCFEILSTLTGSDMKKILYPTDDGNSDVSPPKEIDRIEIARPLVFAFEYALAKLLLKWGIKPYAMVGHSIGEYVAATLSGVFSPEEALKLLLNLPTSKAELTSWELENFEKVLEQTEIKEPTLPYISNVTGDWIKGSDTIGTGHWLRHLHEKDRFAPGLEKLLTEEDAIFMETGPGERLASFIRQHKNKKDNQSLITLVRHPGEKVSDHCYLLDKIGQLWLCGKSIDWKAFYSGETMHRISLPGYPFERQRYWIDGSLNNIDPQVLSGQYLLQNKRNTLEDTGKPEFSLSQQRPNLSTSYAPPQNRLEQEIANLWQQYFGIEQIGVNDGFFELGGDSLKAMTMASMIHKKLDVNIPLPEFFSRPTIKELAEYVKNAERISYSSIEPSEKKEYYPMSPAQKRMYISNQMDRNSIAYNIPQVVALEGKLDKERLARTFKKLIKRHESLRTFFYMVKEHPIQSICEGKEFEIRYYDISEADTGVLIERFIRPFDLAQAPLLRVGIIKENEEKHIMIADIHHIIFDGTSMDVLIKEFTILYTGEELPHIKLQYKDFSQWQNTPGQKELLNLQKAYWLKEFSGEIPVINMPTDYSRPLLHSFAGNIVGFNLSVEQTRALNQLALYSGCTLYMVLLGIYFVFLSKLSGQEDIVIGTPTAGRRHADLEQIIGMFVNTLALRNYPAPKKTYQSFLNDVKERSLAAFENQDYPYEELVENVAVGRDLNRNPLFDTFFILQNTGMQEIEIPSLRVAPYEYKYNSSKFHLTLSCVEVEEILMCTFKYSTKLFNRETIERFITYFTNIVKRVIKNKDQRLSDLEIMADDEKKRILFDFNETKTGCLKDKTIHQLFEEQVKRTPDYIAAAGRGQSTGSTSSPFVQITYRELNEKSNQLANLLTQKGVKPDTIVSVKVHPSVEMAASILGILIAGGAYMLIPSDYPQGRIDYMLMDSGAKFLLNHDLIIKATQLTRPTQPTQLAQPYHLAYVNYTPVDTGKPKSILLEHRNVVNTVDWFIKAHNVGSHTRILQGSHYTFDANVNQIFGSLISGASLHIVKKEIRADMEKLRNYIIDHRINIANFFPSHLKEILFNTGKLESLHTVFSGVENLDQMTKEVIMGKGYRLVNQYGSAETTGDALELDCSPQKPSLGKPISNIKVYIMDKYEKITPIGVVGELYISGVGIARGYLNRPGLTTEKFVNSHLSLANNNLPHNRNPISNSQSPAAVLYKTGDLAKWQADGKIELLGRIDNQVNIRGIRIPLAEIESQLLKNKKINAAVVTTTPGCTSVDDGEEKSLAAYIVSGDKITMEEIRADLTNTLPDYMIPSSFIQVEKIPLNPNGKVDKKTLSSLGKKLETGKKHVLPQNKLQESIALAWKDILELETVGIHENFFDIGGNSIKIIQLITRLKQSMGININIITTYRYNTIYSLASYLEQQEIQKKAIKEANGKENDPLIQIENYITGNFYINAYYKNYLVDNHDYRVLYIPRGLEGKGKLFQELKEKFKDVYPDYIKFIDSEDQIIKRGKIDSKSFSTAMGLADQVTNQVEIHEELNKNLHFTSLLKKNNMLRKYEVSPPQREFLLNLKVIAKKNITFLYDFTYPIEFEGIRKIVIKIINENSLLRSIIVKNSDTYCIEEYDSYSNIQIPFIDLSNYSFDCQNKIQEILQQHLEKPFDVIENVLYRTIAIKLNHSNYKLVFEFNHLVFDGGSYLVLEEQIDEAQKETPLTIEGKKKKNDYYEYATFLSHLKYEKIHLENYLKIPGYLHSLEIVRKRSVTGNMTDDFFEIDLSILNARSKDIYNEILLFSYARLIGNLYGIDYVPLILYSYGRNYKDGKFNDIIGTLQDYIPVSLSLDGNNDLNFTYLLANLMDYR